MRLHTTSTKRAASRIGHKHRAGHRQRAAHRHPLLMVAGFTAIVLAGLVFHVSLSFADLRGTEGLLRISSANILPGGGWSVGLFGQYYQRMSPYAHSVRESYAVGNLSGRFGVAGLAEVFGVIPGEGTLWKYRALPDRDETDENHGGLGDIRIGAKVKAPLNSQIFSVALMAEGSVPSGKDADIVMPGRTAGLSLFSSGEANLLGRICATLDFNQIETLSPLRVHFNAGYWVNREAGVVRFPSYIFPIPGRLENKDVILGGLGLEFPTSRVTLFTELYTEQFVDGSEVASFQECPILISPGAKVALPFGIVATAAADVRLSSDDKETEFNPETALPEWAVTLGFDFTPSLFGQDMDRDGIKDESDLCPTEPEDVDGFEDTDGCPDSDNDRDGVLDVVDKCPNEPETINGYMDTDGCPEPDADKDGVMDSVDKCPGEREDIDGFQDADGCPDADNDADGILDTADKCPNDPETINGYMDADGCPDQAPSIQEQQVDTDGDGVPDSKDKCPSLAEDRDGFQDADGCPDVDNDLDGIIDVEDKCPNEPEDLDGVRDDDGCPDK